MKLVSPNQLRNEMHLLMESTWKGPVYVRGHPNTDCVMISLQKYNELLQSEVHLEQMRKELDGT